MASRKEPHVWRLHIYTYFHNQLPQSYLYEDKTNVDTGVGMFFHQPLAEDKLKEVAAFPLQITLVARGARDVPLSSWLANIDYYRRSDNVPVTAAKIERAVWDILYTHAAPCELPRDLLPGRNHIHYVSDPLPRLLPKERK